MTSDINKRIVIVSLILLALFVLSSITIKLDKSEDKHWSDMEKQHIKNVIRKSTEAKFEFINSGKDEKIVFIDSILSCMSKYIIEDLNNKRLMEDPDDPMGESIEILKNKYGDKLNFYIYVCSSSFPNDRVSSIEQIKERNKYLTDNNILDNLEELIIKLKVLSEEMQVTK